MKKTTLLDTELYPPFEGFPEEGLTFLKQLKKNNTREWFTNHKQEYEDYVKFPMHCLIASLREPIAQFAPEMEINPKRSMFRIYRDVRFSKNKEPYKTHVAAVFHLKGHWESSAGYYVHIEPGSVYLGGGIYMPSSDQLKGIRSAIANRSKEFLAIVESKAFKKKFRTIEGERLQRAPLGYAPDHPMAEWLKHKQFFTGMEWEEDKCKSKKIVSEIAKVYKELHPFIQFLNEAIGK